MYCKSCKFTSFDHLQACPRCGQDWSDVQKALNLDWLVEQVSQSRGQDSPYLRPEELAFQDRKEAVAAGEAGQEAGGLEFSSLEENSHQAAQTGLIDFELDEDTEDSAQNDEDEIVISEPEIDLDAETSLLDFSDEGQEEAVQEGEGEEEISFPELDELFSVRGSAQDSETSPAPDAAHEVDDDLDVLMDLDLESEDDQEAAQAEESPKPADTPDSDQGDDWTFQSDEESGLSNLFDDIEIEIDSEDDRENKDS
jgi:hypothetical protein